MERGQLSIYLLVPIRHKESEMLPLQLKLVSEKKTEEVPAKELKGCEVEATQTEQFMAGVPH